jgi:hypothetical protein
MIFAFLLPLAFGASGESVAAASPTPQPVYDNAPHYSPDSGSLAFISNRGGQRRIYVIRTDGTGLTTIPSQLPGGIGNVAWFPNGDLLFTTYESALSNGADDSIAAVRFRRMAESGADGRIVYQGMNVERPARQGHTTQAISLYERALAIKGRTFSVDHPEIVDLRRQIDAMRAAIAPQSSG